MEQSSNQKPIPNNPKHSFQNALIYNMGCPKNLVDTERVCNLLQTNGIRIHHIFNSHIDSVWINSCCFIQNARIETISVIEQYTSMPGIQVIVYGCFAVRYPETLKHRFPNLTILPEKDPINAINKLWFNNTVPVHERTLSNPYAVYLKISDGCDRACSFCIIPSIKGTYTSFYPKKLIDEAKYLSQCSPVKELIIIAQDTSRYGSDIHPAPSNLIQLVASLSETKLFPWIRIMYLFPSLSYSFLDELFSISRVLPYMDMPLQHVSPRILSRMNRPQNIEHTLKVLSDLRKNHPGLAIRSTFIVGFPGETIDDFSILCDTLTSFRFERSGFFAYSDEEDAPSYSLSHKISLAVIEDRMEQAYQIQHQVNRSINENLVGSTQDVLVESWNAINKQLTARTKWDAPEIDQIVQIKNLSPQHARKIGSIISVKITKAHDHVLEGFLA